MFLYLTGAVVIFGAEINQVLYLRHTVRMEAGSLDET